MATFRLVIKCDNAAFDDDNLTDGNALREEIGSILARLSNDLIDGKFGDIEHGDDGALMDSNGNKVGTWTFTERVKV